MKDILHEKITENLRRSGAQQIFDKLGDWDITREILIALAVAEKKAKAKEDPREEKFSKMIALIGTAYKMRKS